MSDFERFMDLDKMLNESISKAQSEIDDFYLGELPVDPDPDVKELMHEETRQPKIKVEKKKNKKVYQTFEHIVIHLNEAIARLKSF